MYEAETLCIVYTTPFSGAAPYPGESVYMIDIWHQSKKQFSIVYQRMEEVAASKKRPKGEWVGYLLESAGVVQP